MRAKRSKSYKRAMALYTTAFKFRQPYQVLVDADFVKRMSQQKLDPTERLAAILGGDTKIMITQCVVSRLYAEGTTAQAATDLAKTFERRKCNHWKMKETDGECITGIIGNDNRYRYCVASQSPAARGQLRAVPGVPILFETRGMILLEPPSDASVGKRKEIEESKLHVPKAELDQIKPKASSRRPTASKEGDAAKQDDNVATNPSGAEASASLPAATRSTAATRPSTVEEKLERAHLSKKRKARGGPSGPNPLSVKKKKTDTQAKSAKPKANGSSFANTNHDAKGKGKGKGKNNLQFAGGADEADSKQTQSSLAVPQTSADGTVATINQVKNVLQPDPTRGQPRAQGDGTSKKALKRKRKMAEKTATASASASAPVSATED